MAAFIRFNQVILDSDNIVLLTLHLKFRIFFRFTIILYFSQIINHFFYGQNMGKIVNNYELLEQLGQGGMGVVYKARHIHFDEIYAVKRLWEQFNANEMVLSLFLNEAKILRKLNHKNIVQVTDVFTLENQNYIVMEYIKGRSLDEIIKKEVGPIRRERAINLFKQMLEGIAYIHSQPTPIIHRDIKPLNLLVTEDDTVKITDFGIAKVLDAGQNASTVVKGTPVYMSPEQIINPKSVDIRTDVYSLGMTFYEMLCGRTPFSGDTTTTPTAVYAAIINSEVPPPTHFYPGITDALSDFVMKAIHKDRDQRFTNVNEMLGELEKLERSGETTSQGVLADIQPTTNEKSSFQAIQELIPPEANRIQSKEPKEETGDPAVLNLHMRELVDNPIHGSKVVIPVKRRNITWKWVAGIVVLVGLIFVISLPSELTPNEEMVLVQGGEFMMGSNDGDSDEAPKHQVTVSSFMMGKYEVTQELWESIMGINPSSFQGSKKPVEQVSWSDAVEFCNRLSEKERLKKVYSRIGSDVTCDFTLNGYRLPTEAEWEYAARGGNKSKGYKFSGSNNIAEVALFQNDLGRTTYFVGTMQSNELGIYDMTGNVLEWCWDWKGDYSSSSQTDPRGPISGINHVFRGGSSFSSAERCRVTCRGNYSDYRIGAIGLRLVRTVK